MRWEVTVSTPGGAITQVSGIAGGICTGRAHAAAAVAGLCAQSAANNAPTVAVTATVGPYTARISAQPESLSDVKALIRALEKVHLSERGRALTNPRSGALGR